MKNLLRVGSFILIFCVSVFAVNVNTYNLKTGWNLVGTGLNDSEVILDDITLDNSIRLFWVYDTDEGWKAYSQRSEIEALISSDIQLNSILPGTGVWILTENNVSLDLTQQIMYTDTFIGSVKTEIDGNIVAVVDANVTIKIATESFTVLTDENGTYKFNNIPYGDYNLSVVTDGYSSVNGHVILDSLNETYSQIQLYSSTLSYNYTFRGVTIDAITGSGIENVSVKIYQGLDNQLGTILYENTTDSNGIYSFNNIPTGSYTVVCQKDGYIKTVNNAQLISETNNDTITQDFTLAPYSENIRIVLTWGETPDDLDSHLAKMNSETREWHVFYDDENPTGAESSLDVDDVDSYGPETITLTTIDNNATYKYYVHDYENLDSIDSDALSNSGAKITMYIEENEYVFNVPNYSGTIWKVFEIVNGNILPCIGSECMDYESDEYSDKFGLMKVIQSNDIDFSNLPKK